MPDDGTPTAATRPRRTGALDFAEFLRARRHKQATAQAGAALDKLEAHAAAAGLLRLPGPRARKLSTAEAPPVQIGGKPASEIVLKDRR